MLKRILALGAAVLMLLALAGCGGNVARLPELQLEEAEGGGYSRTAPASPDYEDTLEGLTAYMEAGQAVVKDDTENSFTEMSYKEIGAIGGCRYRFTYNRTTVQVEFYEFDPENLDEKGQDCLGSAKEKGRITVLGKEIPVTLHSNGRYLMIYIDEKAESEDANRQQKEWTEKLFLDFHA